MKRIHGLLLGIALGSTLGSSGLALANTADITVTGTIRPGGCVPVLSGGGRYEFGVIPTENLNENEATVFNSSPQQLSVSCASPARFGLHAVDARAGSSVGQTEDDFGLGRGGSKNIGHYSLLIPGTSVLVDGDPGIRLLTYDNGATWAPETGPLSFVKNTRLPAFHSFAPQGSSQPAAVTTVAADLGVRMFVAPRRDLDLSDEIQIDGASTLELRYF